MLEEIDTLLKGVAPDFNTAGNMPYLRAVIHETLRYARYRHFFCNPCPNFIEIPLCIRLYPPVPFDGKQCQVDTVLPNGTTVKTGQFVLYFMYAMGRDPTRWGEDALLFKPERFMTSRRRNAFEYPVFNVSRVLSQRVWCFIVCIMGDCH